MQSFEDGCDTHFSGRLTMIHDPPELNSQPSAATRPENEGIDVKRRRVVVAMLAAGGVLSLPDLLGKNGLISEAQGATPQLTRETLNGIAVFFVPGPDPFSKQQGEFT